MGLNYFGARFWDPQLSIWLSPDAARQFHNPYNPISGDPINNTDPDGNFVCGGVCIAIVAAGVIGATVGGVKAHNRGYDLGDWETYAYVGGGAAVGAGAAWAGAGAAVWATGASGLASGSGAVAATIGGAAGGAVGGGLNTAGMYALDHGVVHDENWNWSEFGTQVGVSIGTGALVGGAIGAASYGLSESVRNSTHQTVENYGFARGRHSDVVSYHSNHGDGGRQRAVTYYAKRVKAYKGDFIYKKSVLKNVDPNARGQAFDEVQRAEIYDNAFYDPNKTGTWDEVFDPTGVFEAVDHEARHLSHNQIYLEQAKDLSPSAQKYFVENAIYEWQQTVADQNGYSQGMKNYINDKVMFGW